MRNLIESITALDGSNNCIIQWCQIKTYIWSGKFGLPCLWVITKELSYSGATPLSSFVIVPWHSMWPSFATNGSWRASGTLLGGDWYGIAPSFSVISTGLILNLPTPWNKCLSITSVRVKGFFRSTVWLTESHVTVSMLVDVQLEDQEVVVGQLNVTKFNTIRSSIGQYWDGTIKKWHVCVVPLWLIFKLQVPS